MVPLCTVNYIEKANLCYVFNGPFYCSSEKSYLSTILIPSKMVSLKRTSVPTEVRLMKAFHGMRPSIYPDTLSPMGRETSNCIENEAEGRKGLILLAARSSTIAMI